MGKYSKGAKFENEVIKQLKKQKIFCIRSAGSKGIVDIVAFARFCDEIFIYFIQCKYGKAVMNKKDQEKLKKIAKEYNAIPVYVYRKKYEKILNFHFLYENGKILELKYKGFLNKLELMKEA